MSFGPGAAEAVDAWLQNGGEDSTYLFHPHITGAKQNLRAIGRFWRESATVQPPVTMREKAVSQKGLCFTIDIGVLTKLDLLRTMRHI